MKANTVYQVNFRGYKYGIVFNGELNTETLNAGRLGVCAGGYGKIKYMPVVWDLKPGQFPVLLKTRLKGWTAKELAESLADCSMLDLFAPDCIALCEHVLKYGHTPR